MRYVTNSHICMCMRHDKTYLLRDTHKEQIKINP